MTDSLPADRQDYTPPHSCRYCDKIILTSKASNIAAQEAYGYGLHPVLSEMWSLSSLDSPTEDDRLFRILGMIKGSSFHEISAEDLHNAVAFECLLYMAISNRLLARHTRSSLFFHRYLIGILIDDDGYVKIGTCREANDAGRYDVRYIPLISKGVWTEFRIFMERGSPTPDNIRLGPCLDMRIDDSLAQAKNWLETCVNEHDECQHKQCTIPTRPARLLRLSIENERELHLVDTDDIETSSQRYVALSYCWGGNQEIKTTKQNVEQHFRSIELRILPATIRDAIAVTIKLGLQYIWVDALCIIQDDEDDKARQIESMAHIFEGAEVTLLTSSAETVYDGFLHRRAVQYGQDQPDMVFKLMYQDDQGSTTKMVFAPMIVGREDYLAARGWTFQERLCSRRILDFGSTCVSWACRSTFSCDRNCGLCSRESLSTEVASEWTEIIARYSRRALTISQDRLPAIAGIASRHRKHSDVYLAGLWKSSLLQELLWKVDTYTAKLQAGSQTYFAPSWSWASSLQAVRFWVIQEGVVQAELVEAEVKLASEKSPFGHVTSGYIKIRGFVTEACHTTSHLQQTSLKLAINSLQLASGGVSDTEITCSFLRDTTETTFTAECKGRISVYLLALFSSDFLFNTTGLVLQKHPAGHFTRLGLFIAHDKVEGRTIKSWLLESVRQEITML